MNSALVTTGLMPLTVNSIELFQHQGILNGQVWDLTGGSATLRMADPDGTTYAYACTIASGNAFYTWTVLNVPGTWVRAWDVTDAQGRRQVSRPLVFEVIASPGLPL